MLMTTEDKESPQSPLPFDFAAFNKAVPPPPIPPPDPVPYDGPDFGDNGDELAQAVVYSEAQLSEDEIVALKEIQSVTFLEGIKEAREDKVTNDRRAMGRAQGLGLLGIVARN